MLYCLRTWFAPPSLLKMSAVDTSHCLSWITVYRLNLHLYRPLLLWTAFPKHGLTHRDLNKQETQGS